MSFFVKSILGAAGVLLLMPAQAQTQDQPITSEEVQSYFERLERQVTHAMEAQDLRKAMQWMEANFADDTVFQISINILRGDDRKGFATLSLDKDDILRLGGMFVGVFQQQAIEAYSLNAEVVQVTTLGTGAATATVRWHESVTVAATVREDDAQQEARRARLSVEAVADCEHLVRRHGQRLTIGLSTCIGEARF